ncbi:MULTISPECIES: hypothetical protein [unclassified Haematospirillum]|uniref:hypothetical protein n=1 Tax=unclassified Haematospirillum TaxID=2622088 RepID=UPI00143B4FFD|nr:MULTISPECIES: hypothetical protein [unclassified Haematospirillum]NKD55474.1 hypothetical protein [Haematospirillum sp. H4890]NKD75614.1 hypothetical protein [Haematospirillum sp. H4485]NKD86724.1 hypothetical protein [Haematospirillum sp. 15-248]
MRVVFLRHGALLPRSILFHVCSGCIVFGLSVLAVAVFSPEDHGRFALLLSGMWVGVSILTAVFLDPFSQRGRCGRTHGRMLQAIFGWFGLSAFLPGILMVGFSDTQWFALPVSGFFLSPGLATVFLHRRLMQAGICTGPKVWIWVGLCPLATCILVLSGDLTPHNLVLVLSITSIGCLAHFSPLRVRVLKSVLAWHVRKGICLVLALPVALVVQQGPVLVVAVFHGPEGAGDWRRVQLLMMPVLQGMAFLGGYLQPRLARLVREEQKRLAKARALVFGVSLSGLSCLWCIGLCFAGDDPGSLRVLLPAHGIGVADGVLACTYLVAASLAAAAGIFVRAKQDNARVFLATLCAGGICMAGLPLCAPYGIACLLALLALSYATNAVVLAWPWR